MPEYSDIYVISNRRDEASVKRFLDCFLSEREESADEYEVPQFSERPDIVYTNATDLVKHCSAKNTEEHAIYWRAKKNKPEHGMVFYLKDGNVIYGLSTDAIDRSFAEELLEKLKAHLGADLGYIGHEASPDVESLQEFELAIESHRP